MEYWLCAIDEMSDQTGIEFSEEQREAAAEIIRGAASVHGEYSRHSEPAPVSAGKKHEPERTPSWWEDTSKLCGSDWVIARQIHQLIASR